MKKLLLALIMGAAFLTPAFSQVRNYVGIVRRVFTPEHMNYIDVSKGKVSKDVQKKLDEQKDIEADYNKVMNPQSVEYAENVDKQTFGTGFIVVLDDGTNLVITNHHVVEGCKSAIIEFIDPDTGVSTIYDNLSVHTLGDKIDIAILTFPEGQKPFKKGLSILDKELNDGDEIWSAGYPGLRNKPEWQFAKGNVTSSKARINELMDSSISTIIQHSAPIDAGNSGGPLVIKDSSAESGYAVVGINTWKASNRELTGFTIPAKVIKSLINNLSDQPTSETVANARVEAFFDLFNKRYRSSDDVRDYVAIQYADTLTPSYVKNAGASGYVYYFYNKTQLDNKFDALSAQIWNKYALVLDKNFDKSSDKYELVSFSRERDNLLVYVYKDSRNENTIVSKWIYETGLWQLNEISFTEDSKKYKKELKDQKLNKSPTNSIIQPKDYMSSVSYIYTMPVGGKIDGTTINKDFFHDGFTLQIEDSILGGWGTYGVSLDWQLTDGEYLKLLGLSWGLQCPFDFTYVSVIPSADVGGVISVFSDAAVYGWYWEGKLSIIFGENGDFGLGGAFKTKYLYPMRDSGKKYVIPTAGVYMIISF